MSNVIFLNSLHNNKKLEDALENRRVTPHIRYLLKLRLLYLKEYHPNSWDKRFVEDMLTFKRPLSDKQVVQLDRVLDEYFDQDYSEIVFL